MTRAVRAHTQASECPSLACPHAHARSPSIVETHVHQGRMPLGHAGTSVTERQAPIAPKRLAQSTQQAMTTHPSKTENRELHASNARQRLLQHNCMTACWRPTWSFAMRLPIGACMRHCTAKMTAQTPSAARVQLQHSKEKACTAGLP